MNKSIQLQNSKLKYKIVFFYWTSSLASQSTLIKVPTSLGSWAPAFTGYILLYTSIGKFT